jgi:hypothetical protein
VNSDGHDLLSARFAPLANRLDSSDWSDVVRRTGNRAERPPRSRRRLALAVAALVLLAAILLVTPAVGLRAKIEQLFGEGEPAPTFVKKNFASLDVGAPAGMAPGVIAGQARLVLDTPISEEEHVVVWAAPTKAGGYCAEYSIEKIGGPHGEGGGGCDAERSLPLSPNLSIPGPISPEGRILKGPVVLGVSVLHPSATVVDIEFEDGNRAEVPLTWISEPINAAFAVYAIPEEHWYSPHLPSNLIVRDASGNELDRDREFLGVLRDLGAP